MMTLNWYSKAKPPNHFLEWSRSKEEPLEGDRFDFKEFSRQEHGVPPEKKEVEFFRRVNYDLERGEALRVGIDQGLAGDKLKIGRTDINQKQLLREIYIKTGTLRLALVNLQVERLHIISTQLVRLEIQNTEIRKLEVRHPRQDPQVALYLADTWVGKLCIGERSIQHYQMRRGGILDIECPTPAQANPLMGDFSLQNVFLPRHPDDFLLRDAQPYRNLRHDFRSAATS